MQPSTKVFGKLQLSASVTVAVLAGAHARLPWPAAIIGGGLMLLVAPLALQVLPDRIVDGVTGLLLLAGGAAAMAAMLSAG